MATYTEAWALITSPALKEKVSVACLDVADDVRAEATDTPNHANRLKWAKSVFDDPVQWGDKMLPALIGANITEPVANITGASDAAIKTAVVNAVDIFADGT